MQTPRPEDAKSVSGMNAAEDGQNLFLRPVAVLELSTRATNCLKSQNIQLIGDIIQITESQFKKIPAAGLKTIHEIKTKLAERGLALLAKPAEPDLDQMYLLQNLVKTLNLPARIGNRLREKGIYFIGDLVQEDEVSLTGIRNLGLGFIHTIKLALYSNSLFLGMQVPDWSAQRLVAIERFKRGEHSPIELGYMEADHGRTRRREVEERRRFRNREKLLTRWARSH